MKTYSVKIQTSATTYTHMTVRANDPRGAWEKASHIGVVMGISDTIEVKTLAVREVRRIEGILRIQNMNNLQDAIDEILTTMTMDGYDTDDVLAYVSEKVNSRISRATVEMEWEARTESQNR